MCGSLPQDALEISVRTRPSRNPDFPGKASASPALVRVTDSRNEMRIFREMDYAAIILKKHSSDTAMISKDYWMDVTVIFDVRRRCILPDDIPEALKRRKRELAKDNY